jgi:hypothetical protein
VAIDFTVIGAEILKNPLVAGAVVKLVVDGLKGQLKSVDESGVVVKNKAIVQPLVYVLTAVTAVLAAGMEGNAAAFDPSSLASFLVQAVIGALGTHEAVKGAKKAVEAVKK